MTPFEFPTTTTTDRSEYDRLVHPLDSDKPPHIAHVLERPTYIAPTHRLDPGDRLCAALPNDDARRFSWIVLADAPEDGAFPVTRDRLTPLTPMERLEAIIGRVLWGEELIDTDQIPTLLAVYFRRIDAMWVPTQHAQRSHWQDAGSVKLTDLPKATWIVRPCNLGWESTVIGQDVLELRDIEDRQRVIKISGVVEPEFAGQPLDGEGGGT